MEDQLAELSRENTRFREQMQQLILAQKEAQKEARAAAETHAAQKAALAAAEAERAAALALENGVTMNKFPPSQVQNEVDSTVQKSIDLLTTAFAAAMAEHGTPTTSAQKIQLRDVKDTSPRFTGEDIVSCRIVDRRVEPIGYRILVVSSGYISSSESLVRWSSKGVA